MEKGFKLQPNCKRRVDGGVLDLRTVRVTDRRHQRCFPSALCLLPSLIKK
jgi:hypothetical protein